jgi:hypothetical protein
MDYIISSLFREQMKQKVACVFFPVPHILSSANSGSFSYFLCITSLEKL